MTEDGARYAAAQMMGYDSESDIPENRLDEWNDLVNILVDD